MIFFTKDMAMDLGTTDTRIMADGKLILEESSHVAIDSRDGRCRWFGNHYHMFDIIPPKHLRYQKWVKPLACGDAEATGILVEKLVLKKTSRLMNKLLGRTMLVAVSLNFPNDMRIAVEDSLKKCGFKEVRFIPAIVAAAIGCNKHISLQ